MPVQRVWLRVCDAGVRFAGVAVLFDVADEDLSIRKRAAEFTGPHTTSDDDAILREVKLARLNFLECAEERDTDLQEREYRGCDAMRSSPERVDGGKDDVLRGIEVRRIEMPEAVACEAMVIAATTEADECSTAAVVPVVECGRGLRHHPGLKIELGDATREYGGREPVGHSLG